MAIIYSHKSPPKDNTSVRVRNDNNESRGNAEHEQDLTAGQTPFLRKDPTAVMTLVMIRDTLVMIMTICMTVMVRKTFMMGMTVTWYCTESRRMSGSGDESGTRSCVNAKLK